MERNMLMKTNNSWLLRKEQKRVSINKKYKIITLNKQIV